MGIDLSSVSMKYDLALGRPDPTALKLGSQIHHAGIAPLQKVLWRIHGPIWLIHGPRPQQTNAIITRLGGSPALCAALLEQTRVEKQRGGRRTAPQHIPIPIDLSFRSRPPHRLATILSYEHPVVPPHESHFMHVPFATG